MVNSMNNDLFDEYQTVEAMWKVLKTKYGGTSTSRLCGLSMSTHSLLANSSPRKRNSSPKQLLSQRKRKKSFNESAIGSANRRAKLHSLFSETHSLLTPLIYFLIGVSSSGNRLSLSNRLSLKFQEKFDLPEAPYVNRAILRAMGRRYCDNRCRLKKKFDKVIVNCPEHIEEADWTYLCNLWQDTVYVGKCNKYKASRSKPRIHHVVGSKPFYKVKNEMKKKKKIMNPDLPELWKETHYSEKRNSWTDGSQTVYDKLKEVQGQSMENGSVPLTDEGALIDAEEAREAAAAAERKCEEALAETSQTHKNTEQLAETMANMQSQINLLLQLYGRNMPSNDANCSTNDDDFLEDVDAMECKMGDQRCFEDKATFCFHNEGYWNDAFIFGT
ncbi:hypothetical protein Vadar_013116 [Vaccinium darrowii]|uniref:Uncharacterized protein n=1 Tax=Vaccinium darrowii TaxID=229202 RepID=A0ACB7Y0A5_9ERIC|nr:hypothetical protein Vadar_013116 [Vaccinium darrowii]